MFDHTNVIFVYKNCAQITVQQALIINQDIIGLRGFCDPKVIKSVKNKNRLDRFDQQRLKSNSYGFVWPKKKVQKY